MSFEEQIAARAASKMNVGDILNDLDDASPKQGTETLSAEPPKWRFVKEAKKSSGYSSAAAGSYVRGKSSDELGAKYHAPDISLYKPTPEKPDVHAVDAKAPSFNQFEKDNEEVGVLEPRNLYETTPYMKDVEDVGKLNIDEEKQDDVAVPEGTFAGLPRFDSSNEVSSKSFREFDNKYEVGKKPGRKGVWFNSDVSDNYNPKSWSYGGVASGGVGRLKFQGTDTSEETFEGSIRKVKKEDEQFNTETVAPMETTRSVGSEHADSSSLKSDEQQPPVHGMSRAVKKKTRWLVILVLLLIPLVLILAILLGKEKKKEGSTPIVAAAAPFITENATVVPSMAPSTSSILACPTTTKLISVEDPSSQMGANEISTFTWYVKDACTGDIISSCKCSQGTFVIGSNRQEIVQQGRGSSLRNLQNNVIQNQCVPVGGKYEFVVEAADSDSECCGFDATSYVVKYGDAVIATSEEDGSGSTSDKSVVFGEETACSTEAAQDSSPTNQPTPACSNEKDFNLCLAVDMSGSVCNGGFFGFGSSDCAGCPLFECRNIFLDSDTCCSNFSTIQQFSQLMIRALAEFPAEKSFSIVQFASDASIVSSPQQANDALSTVSNLSYTGGVTNHGAAIDACRQSLSSSDPGRKKFMMLITDGDPTAPENDPEGVAIQAATQAKEDGMFIIPVFISPSYTYDPFMTALSSDGKVFDVTSFDGLLSIQESLCVLTTEELERIEHVDMDKGNGGAAYKELLIWCTNEVADASRNKLISELVAQDLRNEILKFRSHFGTMYAFDDQPAPFFLFIFLPMIAISDGLDAGTGDNVYWVKDVVQGVIIFLTALVLLGLWSLGNMLGDPYGDDLLDLSVLHYINVTWTHSNRMLHAQQTLPFHDQEERILRNSDELGEAWDMDIIKRKICDV